MNTSGLLEQYTRDGSEAAFEELVRQYINLVYSTALRRVGGATALAQDVTQVVFTDLARKAASLGNNVMLGGWLHRHTGFVAASLLRAEQRRRNREKQAVEINTLNQAADADWKEVGPMLDAAMDQLQETDRDALVLRYFEQRDLRTIGAMLGLSEDAAQKRVSRAVDKLRQLLAGRGATIPAVALALLLEQRAVHAAPAWLAAGISKAALATAGAGVGAGLLAGLAKLVAPAGAKIALAGAAAAIVALAVWTKSNHALWAGASIAQANTPPTQSALQPTSTLAEATQAADLAARMAQPLSPNALRLMMVDAVTGKPVPDVHVDYRGWEGKKFTGKKLTGDHFGVCDLQVPRATSTELELTTRIDGFADTRVRWLKQRGDVIPNTYTVRLDRPVRIGGSVLDPDGRPVIGAKVGFNHSDDVATVGWPQDHHFQWLQVSTDEHGHWTINRMAPEMLRAIYGSASHSNYVESALAFANRPDVEAQLRAGTFSFHLGRPVTVRGWVTGPDGAPLSGAKILVGKKGMSDRRQAESGADGAFVVPGCRPGKAPVSAEADGFAAATVEAELSTNMDPVRLTLQPGKVLILHLVTQTGQPVPEAWVWLDTMRQVSVNDPDYGKLTVQAEFTGKPDAEGYVIWSNAPDTELVFDISAPGCMRVNGIKVLPDGQEHLLTLPPALVVSGTVRDANTQEPVPHFRIVSGWPTTNFIDHTVGAHWSSFERDILQFSDGQFQHSFEMPLIFGMANPGYILKFEADGYASFTSRPFRADEGQVQLDVLLNRANDTAITVLLPDGSPAVQAEVGLLSPQANLELVPGGFSHGNVDNGAAVRLTDAAGTFKLPSDDTIRTIVVACPGGYAETAPAALAFDPTIRLQPWGGLAGTYQPGGQPAAGRELLLSLGYKDSTALRASFEAYRVRTDQTGRFVFPLVPPGKHKLVSLVPADMDFPELNRAPGSQHLQHPTALQHVPVADVEIRPGETNVITVGGGYVLRATLHWQDTPSPAVSHLYVNIQTGYPPEFADAIKAAGSDPAALASFQQNPRIRDYLQHAQQYQAVIHEQTVSAEGLPAGNYILVIGAVPQTAPGQRAVAWIASETSFTVPSDPPTGTLDLGELALHGSGHGQ